MEDARLFPGEDDGLTWRTGLSLQTRAGLHGLCPGGGGAAWMGLDTALLTRWGPPARLSRSLAEEALMAALVRLGTCLRGCR